jgi:lipid A 4'-phosphatase
MQKPLLLFINIILIMLILVVGFVHLDEYIAHLPYNLATRTFYGDMAPWCGFVYKLVPAIVIAIIVTALFALIIRNKLPSYAATIKKVALVTLLSLAIGPGLIANSLLKDNWGRPRPYQVLRDGKKFKPFYQPNFANSQDNSFPSGHATIGFFLGVPLLAMGRRKLGMLVSLAGGFVVGLVRILQGGHYLSDVVFSGIIIWGVGEIVLYCYNKFAKGE